MPNKGNKNSFKNKMFIPPARIRAKHLEMSERLNKMKSLNY